MTMDDGGVPIADASAGEDAGQPRDDASVPPADGGPTGAVGFTAVFATIFYPHCSPCHNGGALSPTPLMSDRSALVGVESTEVPGVLLVSPGDPNGSYLYRKVMGTHAEVCAEMGEPVADCGLRMPRGTDPMPLGDGDLDVVRAWIEGGALP